MTFGADDYPGGVIDYGEVVFSFALLLSELQAFAVEIREVFPGTDENYLSLYGSSLGDLSYSTDLEPTPIVIGSYMPNVPMSISMNVRPQGGPVGVLVDDVLLVQGLGSGGTGVGSIRFVLLEDSDSCGVVQLDDLVGTLFDEGVSVPHVGRPLSSRLVAAPNPFTASTRIEFEATRTSSLCLDIFDVSGRRVRQLRPLRGQLVLEWDGTSDDGLRVPVGVYFVSLRSQDGRIAANRIVRAQ